VFAYPAQPDRGSIRLRTTRGKILLKKSWGKDFGYNLKPGSYELIADARFKIGQFVIYDFPLIVRRSGS
jgi:hypothetical protein